MTDGRSLGTLVARASRWQTVKLGATQRGAGTVANRRKPAANPVEQGRGVCHEADLSATDVSATLVAGVKYSFAVILTECPFCFVRR